MPAGASSFAIHVGADVARAGAGRWGPATVASEDTVRRATELCRRAGIAEQRSLAGERASRAALLGALTEARAALTDGGSLVVTFAGHTERGDGPPGSACWCLFDGGLELSQLASELSLFPSSVRQVLIIDTCYAAAITAVLLGTQQVLVLACCGEDQTTVDRASSEFMVRLDGFLRTTDDGGSLGDLRRYLEDDTPDCERPAVWTNVDAWWPAPALSVLRPVRSAAGQRLMSSDG